MYSYIGNIHIAYYLVVVIAVSLIGAFFLGRHLSIVERKRKKRLDKADDQELLAYHINENVDAGKLKEKSLNNLEKRFSITRRTLYILLVLMAILLAMVPVVGKYSPTLVSVLVAGVSVVVGIAAKPFIENLICGLALCYGRLARIGDVILVDGEYGTIEDVTLTHCIVRRWDWLRYVIPNSIMMTKEFVNYSLIDNHRWVFVEFWVDNESDMSLVEEIATRAPKASQYYSDNEEPRLWVVELTPESAKCMVVAWATTAVDGWMLSIDIRKELIQEFQKHNIKTHNNIVSLDQKAATSKFKGMV